MEAVKIGRRRVHDIDCDGYRQMKRRMANGLCHVEAGGGTWHVSAGLMPDKSLLSEVKPQQHQQPHPLSKLDPSKPGGAGVGVQSQGGGRTAGPESLSTLPDPQPVLPPSLRESERMQSVERWINSLPTDAPVYAQTSLTDIIPISNPKSFPDELSISESQQQPPPGEPSRSYDYFSSSSSQPPPPHHLQSNPSNGTASALSQQNCSSPQRYGGLNSRACQPPPLPKFDPTNATNTSVGPGTLLGPRHPGPTSPSALRAGGVSRINCTVQARNNSKEHGHRFPMPNPALEPSRDRSPIDIGAGACSTRFFDDHETQFVVKLFSDYFTSGSCPSLSEVRRRISRSLYQVQRNPTSIRAKVKRLQASGRWADYAML